MELNVTSLPPSADEICELIKSTGEQFDHHEFRPIAYYDDRLDCIRVIVKDCSFTEWQLNSKGGLITILQANHREEEDEEWVGFTLKGVGHILHQCFGDAILGKSEAVRLSQIIDEFVKKYPDDYPILSMLSSIAARAEIEEVEFDQAA